MKLSHAQFADALAKGFGRAFLHVKQSDPKDVREPLLHACLNSLTYDPQCEGSRGSWLYYLIEATGEIEYYSQPIIELFSSPQLEEDIPLQWQIAGLMGMLAERGNKLALKAVSDRFYMPGGEDMRSQLADAIIISEGVDALVPVVSHVGGSIDVDDKYADWDCWLLYETASERFGVEVVDKILDDQKSTEPGITTFLNEVTRWKEEERKRELPGDKEAKRQEYREEYRKQHPSLEELIDSIEETEEPLTIRSTNQFRSAGIYATEEERQAAYQKLRPIVHEGNNAICLFRIFSMRPLPEVDLELLEYVKSDNDDIRWAAIRAFRNLKDSRVHDIAMRIITEQQIPLAYDVIDLIQENYRPEDAAAMESLIMTNPLENIETIHNIGMPLLGMYSNSPGKSLVPLLLWAYENTPCSMCRNGVFEALVKEDSTSDEILEEALYDCYDETRELAESLLK